MHVRSLTAVLLLAATSVGPALADDGNISPKEIVAAMNVRRIQIRKTCYESAPAKADTSVKLDVTIGGTGIVTDVQQRDPSGPEEIRNCVVAEMRKTTFVASPKGGWFRWPFIFKGP
ncbi:MAG: hypothetical protein ACXVEF_08145 [Polyangiales bacterium]